MKSLIKKLITYSSYFLLKFAISLRYRIDIKGLDELKQHKFKREGGLFFLANHPAEIDPCILMSILWGGFKPHPVALESLFHRPFLRTILEGVGALPVPDFEGSSNSFKRKQIDKTYDRLFALLNNKENLLLYPAGGLKREPEEVIGGASGVHHILSHCPHANVVLVKTRGLWGSSFSRAQTGKSPPIGATFFHAFKVILKNGIFFVPKRHILFECEVAGSDFPQEGSKMEINRYLERWFNKDGPEPLNLVSYSFWRKDLPTIAEKSQKEFSRTEAIPEDIQSKVKAEVAQLAGMKIEDVSLDKDLARDLGLDSLDSSELVLFLKDEFGINQIQSSDLTTVESVMLYAARFIKGEHEDEEAIDKPLIKWEKQEGRPLPEAPTGNTIQEAFLNRADKMGHYLACADLISGEVSYKRLKMMALLMSRVIAKLPGEHIGIMLPASVAVNVIILATLFAGKIPVMINWTLGERNLKSVADQSKISVVISSWGFLNRLENIDLTGIDEKFILLEDMRRELTWKDKLAAFALSKKQSKEILKFLKLNTIQGDQTVAILFTSGTENVPKGVPLSHRNILTNLQDAYKFAGITETDILLGALPPFHSFGFAITGLFPLLAGLRVAFSPNPTDGKRIAAAFEKWKATIFCIAPTFLKNLLRVGTKEQLDSLRLCVVGAEKTPAEVFEKMHALCPKAHLMEGYGITECSPVLTLNTPGKPPCGVGKPLERVKLLIVHPETYEKIPQGKDGLILAHGPNIFDGYLDKNIAAPFKEIDGKKWYITGDLGSINANGCLVLSGRLKRFVKIGGEMISLSSIEDALIDSGKKEDWKLDPDQPSLAVISVEEEGKKGEIILFTTFPVALETVNRALKQQGMSNLVRISRNFQLSAIPLLGTGKVDYRALAAKLDSGKVE